MTYVYQEFPKWKYHPEKGGKIVQNAEEEKALGKGWYDNPNQFPKPSKVSVALDAKAKPWFTKWEWAFKMIGALIVIAAAVVGLIKALHR